ncbi:unnamed protein product [Ambrosiozyma monospora]|uniref:Unnamed protein product n=1 Tax=Ambrosiozyma monospora TaxID=43982 RepID=A0ACB5U517_AMBMO|nr:unnamed protein product [Ambrosiozyma monospora]
MLVQSNITTALLSLSAVASASEIALYWGQATSTQDRLSSYCQKGDADIFLVSFMDRFSSASGAMDINFAGACSTQGSNGLLKCDQIAEDIKTCQGLGKKILLSLGGSSGSYGFASDSDGEGFAETLWNYFGGGSDVSSSERPFGDSVVDGFDFDIEMGSDSGYAALVTKLREYFDKDSSKQSS